MRRFLLIFKPTRRKKIVYRLGKNTYRLHPCP